MTRRLLSALGMVLQALLLCASLYSLYMFLWLLSRVLEVVR